ncbi:glycosyltransferase [Shouchella sp. JSM 1781072]|uniref:glycosyltransferase n=1 Tax=Bacillaceae TaxID=186817 RepID=UPI000C08065D|nr:MULTISPECIES: glycosyltransferase [Bacillaceae]UTR08169.1 glycosyltransferase [Alkalihalobacillus sp. LMS6]
MKHICFLVAEHPFLDARIFQKEAKSLVRRGYKVTLIVPKKKGRLFDTSGRLLTEQFLEQAFEYEGVHFLAYDPPKQKRQLARQIALLKSGKLESMPSPCVDLAVSVEADLYQAHEFASCYDGVMVKRALKSKGKEVKLVYDSHELVPDPLEPYSQRVFQQMSTLLKELFLEVDTIFTVSPSIRNYYQKLGYTKPIDILYNSPFLMPFKQEEKHRSSPLVLGYIGKLTKNKGDADKLIEIVKRANQTIPLQALIIGDRIETESIPATIRKNIRSTGWLPYEQIVMACATIDVGWIELNTSNALNRMYSMPNKFFSYLERAIPPIVPSSKDMEDFINTYECGFIIEKSGSVDAYVEKLIDLYQDRSKLLLAGQKGRYVLEKTYSWDQMEYRLYARYAQLFQV